MVCYPWQAIIFNEILPLFSFETGPVFTNHNKLFLQDTQFGIRLKIEIQQKQSRASKQKHRHFEICLELSFQQVKYIFIYFFNSPAFQEIKEF